MQPAIFLDRDGVLNRAFVRDGITRPPATIGEVELMPRVIEGLLRLKAMGFKLIVVTNQPDVSRGIQSRAGVEQINKRLGDILPLDAIYVCYHDNADNCACRKPAPGMLLAAAKEHAIDLPRSFMVGDRATDIAAGQAAGCQTFLIGGEDVPILLVKPTWKAADLMEVAEQVAVCLK
jgi:D-glycero-D-manno-heptose 1,7-bisphosphate phosphatase